MFQNKQITNLLWIIPGIVAFFIALIPTLSYQWPLTLDIYTHIHIAQVYSQYGITFIDPTTNPPAGTPIVYPPLFSLLLMVLDIIFRVDYFSVARFLQPVLAFLAVSSVSYVAKKYYGNIAGISAGFLILSSYLFSRFVSPLPETLALIFVPLAIYFYYKSTISKKYKYAIISSFIFLLIILTHQATTLILFLTITAITIVVAIIERKKHFLIIYSLFLSLPIIVGLILSVAALIVAPGFVSKIYTYGISAVTGYTSTLPISDPISDAKYLVYLGIVMIFAIAGAVIAFKRRETRDIFIIVWILVIFFLSKSYWFGVNVYTIRMLVHLLLPLSILGGMGLSYLYIEYKKTEFKSKRIRSLFLIAVFIISSLFAITTVSDPQFNTLPKYNAQPYSESYLVIPQLIPPTNSDIELTNWFKENGDKKSAVVSNNYVTNIFIQATANQPIAGVQSSEHVIEWGFGSDELKQKDIGYFIFDKRLNFTSNSSQKIISHGTFIFYNNYYNITSLLPNTQLLYQNQNYMVFKI
ncbi:6-pyruvoyltetrahydropterin synthase [Methanobacterium sp. SMA-27]|uniref:6-pyruvoyltetrahydropterin synthase n=1 Tax=Methanobacterium sp. SMA-27 TaxID=1495336 RepID=UPI00064FDDBC|nr:6-pyruvoyltetrahydropterin synthase [Methanobacterium sp. SMA-27]